MPILYTVPVLNFNETLIKNKFKWKMWMNQQHLLNLECLQTGLTFKIYTSCFLIWRSWLSTTPASLGIARRCVWAPVPLQVRPHGLWSSCCCFWSRLAYLCTNTAIKWGGRSSLHSEEARRRRTVTRLRQPTPIHTSMWGVQPSRCPFMKTWPLKRLKATPAMSTRGGKWSYTSCIFFFHICFFNHFFPHK